MINTPKGQAVPQTVENLQDIMAADAVALEAQDRLIGQLRGQINNLQQTQEKLRERIRFYKRRIDAQQTLLKE